MAEEKSKLELVEQEILNIELNGEKPWPAKKKFKSQRDSKTTFAKNTEIGLLTKLIVKKHDRGVVIGYMLCHVLDWYNDTPAWSEYSKFIVKILDVSSNKLTNQIGRLREISAQEQLWFGTSGIVEVGATNWHKYKIEK